MNGSATARVLRSYSPRIGHDDRPRRDGEARRSFLRRRRGVRLQMPEATGQYTDLWEALLVDHDGDQAEALGELVAVLVDAGLLGEKRA